MAIRFCSNCKQPMRDGYLFENLDIEYFCSENCLTTEHPFLKDETKRAELYDQDGFYYTDWADVEPFCTILPVYTHGNTDSLWLYENDAQFDFFFNGNIHDQVIQKWILITDKEENELLELKQMENSVQIIQYSHNSFIFPIERTFQTLELAKSAYLEEENSTD